MGRPRRLVILLGAAAAAAAAVRRGRRTATGHRVLGGVLIGHTGAYDALSRFLLGRFFGRIAADVAAVAPTGARVLEVGCGPGHLSLRLARQHGLEVTGLDLDPAMIARANADRTRNGGERRPSFLVGDVAALAFPDQSFDLAVSTLSMHHWANPTAGLAEISRVLRPGGRALIWDLRPGALPFHAHAPTPSDTPMALRFGWSARPIGAGPGSCPSPSGSSCSTPTAHPGTPKPSPLRRRGRPAAASGTVSSDLPS